MGKIISDYLVKMAIFTENYDVGHLNVPGFGQSVTNPLAPVFYDSLGVAKDLSVYNNIYASKTINAGVAFTLGKSVLTLDGFNVAVPTNFQGNTNFEKSSNFQSDVSIQNSLNVLDTTSTQRIVVGGIEFVPKVVLGFNGAFLVLAQA